MLPGDSEASARTSARRFNDHRVRHYYDPDKRSGKAVARSLGYADRVAWDIYLFYAPGSEWSENPPIPTYWMHQLRENWPDHEHFYIGEDLVNELYMAMKRLLEVET
jgi:hypothetical protein